MYYKRSQFLVNKRFQFKFAFFVCTWIFALSMIYPIIVYNIFEYFLKLATTMPSAALSIDKVKAIENQVLWFMGILQLVFLSITFILSVFLSHRIAGPIYKLRRAMEDVARGNFDQRISFRKADHFKEMQDTFNEMVQHLSVKR